MITYGVRTLSNDSYNLSDHVNSLLLNDGRVIFISVYEKDFDSVLKIT